jgi:hypothetical protein
MPFALELFFEPDLDRAVRQVWEQVSKEAGVPNKMADTGNRPHISLAVFNDCNIEAVIDSLKGIVTEPRDIEIDLNSIGTFASQEGVLFLAPVVTGALIKVHLDCQAKLKDLAHGMWPYYLPEKLVFHCTVNTGLNSEEINRAIIAVKGIGLPKAGKASEIGLARIPEMEFIGTFKIL